MTKNHMDEKKIIDFLKLRSLPIPSALNIVEDTTKFMSIDRSDVLLLDNTPYFVKSNEKEIGFGMDGEPKYWVKRALNLNSGELQIIKLVFHEKFSQKVGDFIIRFFRNPEKESAVLEAVKNHPDFMHGFTVKDIGGNAVRIIEYIPGMTLNRLVVSIRKPHIRYIHENLPKILSDVCRCFSSLGWLHEHGLVHGDVRWDHLIRDKSMDRLRWIVFDYDYYFPENPFGVDLFGIGKILAYVIGKGPYIFSDIKYNPDFSDVLDLLTIEDFSLIQKNLLMNLSRLFPYLPRRLNNILLMFSGYTTVFYDSAQQVVEDLSDAIRDL
jgi:hypothetical protein